MNQKDTIKIKIKNNKIISEAGTEYGAFLDDVKTIGKAIGDAYKGIGTVVKSAWQNTIGLSWKLYKNIRKEGGVIKGINKTNKWLAAENQKSINDLDTLVKAQPGYSDMNTFINLTSPGLNTLDAITKKSHEILKDKVIDKRDEDIYKEQRKKLYLKRSEIALYNIVMSIYAIKNKNLAGFVKENIRISSSLRNEDIEAEIQVGSGTRKINKLKISKEALDSRKNTDFINMLKVIIKFYKLDQEGREKLQGQIKSKSGEKDSRKLRRDIGYLSEPGEDVEKIFNLLIAAEGDEKIKNKIYKLEVWTSLDSFSSRLCDKTLRKSILLSYDILNSNLKESKFSLNYNTLTSKVSIKNSKILLEEKESMSEEEFELEKNSRLASLYLYYAKMYYLYYATVQINLTIMNSISKINSLVLKELVSKKDTTNTIESVKSYLSQKTAKEIKDVNKVASDFNNLYKSNYPEINTKTVQSLISFDTGSIKKANAEIDKIKEPNQKELIKSENLLELINTFGSQFSQMGLAKEADNIFKTSSEAENSFKDVLFKFKPLLNKPEYVEIISSVDENYKEYYNKGRQYYLQIKYIIDSIKKAEEEINLFNNKKSELESLIEKLKAEAEKEVDKSEKSTDNTSDVDSLSMQNKEETENIESQKV